MTFILPAISRARARLSSEMLARVFWSFSNFATSLGLRLASNVVLTRLLDPQIFGIMVVLNAMRFGFELLTDVGIEQNIVRHKDGLESRFFNTAWTLQMIRGAVLTVVFLVLSPALASFYEIDVWLFVAIAFAPFLNGLHSTSVFALVKTLDVKRRTLFEFRAELVGFVVSVALALVTPTAWALVAGMLISILARTVMSYFLPHPSHRPLLDWGYVKEIILFGRWIMISSIVMFAATSLDKLVLGKISPLELLGIYGLARTIADIPALMARRLTYQLIFPMLASAKAEDDEGGIRRLDPARLKLVLLAAVGIGVGVGSGDWAVAILYDARYAQAGWMLSLLLVGAFVSTLANFNEGVLMGAGKPAYESGANVVRFAILAVGLWVGYSSLGMVGVILATIASEGGRYLVVLYGQRGAGLSYLRQDAIATAAMLAAAALWVAARVLLGWGTPWDLLTIVR